MGRLVAGQFPTDRAGRTAKLQRYRPLAQTQSHQPRNQVSFVLGELLVIVHVGARFLPESRAPAVCAQLANQFLQVLHFAFESRPNWWFHRGRQHRPCLRCIFMAYVGPPAFGFSGADNQALGFGFVPEKFPYATARTMVRARTSLSMQAAITCSAHGVPLWSCARHLVMLWHAPINSVLARLLPYRFVTSQRISKPPIPHRLRRFNPLPLRSFTSLTGGSTRTPT